MKIPYYTIYAIPLFLLYGCAQPNEFNEKNISAAINQKLEEVPFCRVLSRMKASDMTEFRNTLDSDSRTRVDNALNLGAIPVQGMASIAWASPERKKEEREIFQGLSESGFLDAGQIYTYKTGGWLAADYAVIFILPSIKPYIKKMDNIPTFGENTPLFRLCFAHPKVNTLKHWSKPTGSAPYGLAVFTASASLDTAFGKSSSFQELMRDSKETAKMASDDIEVKIVAMNDGLMVKDEVSDPTGMGM